MTATPMSFLSVDRLSVEFKTRGGLVRALHDVSLDLAKGEILGVVGESGSGKSVTAYTVTGLLDAAGRVAGGTTHYDGIDLTHAPESERRKLRGGEISMIFQNPRAALNPIRAVGKQIEDVLREHALATRQNAKERAIDMLKAVKIVEPERRYWSYPFELSGGMCQRVMIAIALACRPRLLIADEPTTGLDVTTQKATMDLMTELAAERGMAVLLITHDLGLAAQYCNRIVVMQKGRVVESGNVHDLFTRPRHPYTKGLIAASPGPRSRLEDLTAGISGESEAAAPSEQTPRAVLAHMDGRPLLRVTDLVKEYPHAGSGGGKLSSLLRREGNDDGPPPAFRAVDGISFSVMPGESVGLVGESGCGKSTTSSMITRLLDPTSGTIEFDGEDIGSIPAKDFAKLPQRRAIQMVFQDPTDSLNPRFSAADAIADPLRRMDGLRGKALRERIEELARQVGLPVELLGRLPHQLSGGQKARVGIARAIAVNPRLLILDEPTSALDVSVQALVLQLLDRLRRELGMAYIFVSHDLNVVRLLCERVIVMNRGRIVEEGEAESILRAPRDSYTRSLVTAIPHFDPESMRGTAAV